MPDGKNTQEYRIVKKNYPNVSEAIAGVIDWVCQRLLAEGLITDDQKTEACNRMIPASKRASDVTGLLLKKVEQDTQNFQALVGVLEQDMDTFGTVLKHMGVTETSLGARQLDVDPLRESRQKSTNMVATVLIINCVAGEFADTVAFLSTVLAYNFILASFSKGQRTEKSFLMKNLLKLKPERKCIVFKNFLKKLNKEIKIARLKLDIKEFCKNIDTMAVSSHGVMVFNKYAAYLKEKDPDTEQDFIFYTINEKRDRYMKYCVSDYDLKCKYGRLSDVDGYPISESIRQPHDSPQNSQHSNLDADADGDTDSTDSSAFSSSSGGASHDESSNYRHDLLGLNRRIMLQRLSYRPFHRIGFHGPIYFSESDSNYDIASLINSEVSTSVSCLYGHDSDSSIELSLNADGMDYVNPLLQRKSRTTNSATTIESSHYTLKFTDTSGSEL